MQVKAKLCDYNAKQEKYYGTKIQLYTVEDGADVGNPLKVWFFDDERGEDKGAMSEREIPENCYFNDHYESIRNLEVAKQIVDAINNADIKWE